MTFEAIALGAERISVPENDAAMMSASTMEGKSNKTKNKASNGKRICTLMK